MAKKNRRKAESIPVAEPVSVQETAVQESTPAQNGQSKRSARVAAASLAEEQRKLRMGIILGVVFFVVLSLSPIGSIKGIAMAAMLVAVAAIFFKRENFCSNFSWPVIFVLLYVVILTISTFYALATKFALTEFLKVILGLSVFILVLCFETRNTTVSGLRTATAIEVAMAIASFISIDFVSTRIFSGIIVAIFAPLNQLYHGIQGADTDRLQTLFENPNVFAGCAGLAVFISLGLLSATPEKKMRRVHLACLLITSTAFILAFSRAAAGMIAIAFLVYLFLERGEKRVNALVVMVETLVFALIAAIPVLMTATGSWSGLNVFPLLLLIVCTIAYVFTDEKLGLRVASSMAKFEKAAILVPVTFVAAAVVFLVLAMNVTTGTALKTNETYIRTETLSGGNYALTVQASDDVHVTIVSQSRDEVFMGISTEIYSGSANGASFVVPDDSMVTTFRFSANAVTNLDSVKYSGTTDGDLKLDYVLLPTAVVTRLVGMFQSTAFQQRIMLFEDGLALFARQPVQGLGLGSFENALAGIQEFHYETKYVHNHYIQCMVDAGLLGLVAFLGTLLSCAYILGKAWLRGKNESHPFIPALFGALLFSALHAFLEVVYSASFYLPIIFAVFALIVLCSGKTMSVSSSNAKLSTVWLQRGYLAIVAVWIVFLGLNIYAKSSTTYLSYPALVTATKLDRYERNDYMLTYVHSIVTEERTAEQDAQMYEYLERLEQANSNTIPLYLGRCYFELGNVPKAFDMLRKFTAYTASDEEKWDAAYRQAAQYYEESEEYTNGLTALVKDMNEWNNSHVGEIILANDIAEFIVQVLAVSSE